MENKPTEEELLELLNHALDAITKGRFEPVRLRNGRPTHIENNIEYLEIYCSFNIEEEDYWDIVYECIKIATGDPIGLYKEPEDNICSHREAEGERMWAFVVTHEDFSKDLYFKFCLQEKEDGHHYLHINCHP